MVQDRVRYGEANRSANHRGAGTRPGARPRAGHRKGTGAGRKAFSVLVVAALRPMRYSLHRAHAQQLLLQFRPWVRAGSAAVSDVPWAFDPGLVVPTRARRWRREPSGRCRARATCGATGSCWNSPRARAVPVDIPWRDLTPEQREWIWRGDRPRRRGGWYGLDRFFAWLERAQLPLAYPCAALQVPFLRPLQVVRRVTPATGRAAVAVGPPSKTPQARRAWGQRVQVSRPGNGAGRLRRTARAMYPRRHATAGECSPAFLRARPAPRGLGRGRSPAPGRDSAAGCDSFARSASAT